MIILKEGLVNEGKFRYNAVKNLQVSGTKAKITIEVDLAETVKSLRYDLNHYGITQGQLDYGYMAEVIAHQLDWQAYALSRNEDHELAHVFADLNGN
jgi:hypothetical protein